MSGILSAFIGRVAGVVTDAYFNLVTLLLPGNGTNGAQNNTFLDSSSNNFTITRNGNTTQGTFSPFSQTGWSNYFDGSSCISTADSADFTFGSSDFTIQGWVFSTVTGALQWMAGQGASNAANTSISFAIQKTASNKLNPSVFTGGTQYQITSTGDLPANQWVHIAFVRDGNTCRLYINGVQDGTVSVTGVTVNDSSNQVSIGQLGEYTVNRYTGYVSNFSIIKGTCSYPSGTTFTVPTSPLSASATNQSLLTCTANRFIDTNTATTAKTITVTGTPSVQAFSPFAPTAEYTPATVGGSGYFDGSSDYLTVPSNTAFEFGTGNFTVEFYVYVTSFTPGATDVIISNYQNSTTGWTIGIFISTGKFYAALAGDGVQLDDPNALITNSWVHLCLVRSSTTASFFVNGSRVATVTNSTNISSTSNLHIGTNVGGGALSFNGYISNLRVVKGTAVYDPTITTLPLPTTPLTAITNTQLLCNFTNAGITDATAKNDLETVGNAQISTTQSKFGGSSMSFDGNGDYLFIPQSNNPQNLNWELVRGDFTIEFWFRANTVAPTIQGLIVKFDGDAASRSEIQYMINLAGSSLNCIPYQGGTVYDITFTSAIAANTWYHVAFVRSGTSVYAYLDGSRNATIRTITGDLNSGTNWPLYIGSYTEGGVNYAFNGFIDDLRITKFARYSGATITVPTAAFALQ